jgi:hypothetical protein
MKAAFDAAFKEMVGQAYTHDDVKLTDADLRSRPTILLQLAGAAEANERVFNDTGGEVVGLAGELDPDHPFDVVVAVPASHYYEYDPDHDTYTARFYADEGGGNVIGANSMMGHDVFFEVDADRVGWSESPCDYDALVQPYLDSGDLVPATDSSRQQEPGDAPEDEPKDEGGAPEDEGTPDEGTPEDGGTPDEGTPEDGGTPDQGGGEPAQNDESGNTDGPGDGGEEPGGGEAPDAGGEGDAAGDSEPPNGDGEPESEGGNGAAGEPSEEDSSSHDANEPSEGTKGPPSSSSSGVCSATCRFGAAASVLIAGVVLVLFLVRRRGSGARRRKRYFMAHNVELELGEIASGGVVVGDEYDDYQVQYRDRRSQYDETGIMT